MKKNKLKKIFFFCFCLIFIIWSLVLLYDNNRVIEKGLATEVIVSKYSKNNNEGLVKINQDKTEQTLSTIEYRYSGSENEVKNYVMFNNEVWRIIGVFEVEDVNGNFNKRLKVIRNESIGSYSWDSSNLNINSGYGINQWGVSLYNNGKFYEGADIMRELNSLYYNNENGNCYVNKKNESKRCDFKTKKIGLIKKYRNMVATVKWYTGATDYNIDAETSYKNERMEKIDNSYLEDSVQRKSSWIGKVGLIYASDYGYASSYCFSHNTLLINYHECIEDNWLFNNSKNYWMLTPYIGSSGSVHYRGTAGPVGGCEAERSRDIFPVVYLKQNVKIIKGNGTKDNMYILDY